MRTRWAGGRPRRISDEDIEVIVAAATARPEKLGLPVTHWSLRKLAACLGSGPRPVAAGRERLRQILHARGISFQRTRTWKGSTDPDRDAKLDRIECVTSKFPDRCFCLRSARAAIGPALSWQRVGGTQASCPAARHLPPHPGHPLLPWLLRHRR